MKESLRKMIGAASTLVLVGLFVVAAAPASAGEMDLRIKALEQELTQLKGEQAEVKEAALAAMAKMPSFKYRPGGGLTITGADKSWAYRARLRFHVHMYNEPDGDDSRGRPSGNLFFRRSRLDYYFYWANGFYQWRHGVDYDTGNQTVTQNVELQIKLGKMNPWLPTLYIQDAGGPSAFGVARSSTSSAATEIGDASLNSDGSIDILSHQGLGLGWWGKKVGSGTVDFYVEYIPAAGAKRNTIATTDHKQFFLKLGAKPFKNTKNKWLKKTKLGFVWKTNSIDNRGAENNNRLRIRSYSRRPNRITVFDTGTNIGEGQHNWFHYGFEWGVGPYLNRTTFSNSTWAGEDDVRKGVTNLGKVSGRSMMFAHELFIWSPKGFLTGSSKKAGSVLLGYRYGRADSSCGSRQGADCVPGNSTSSRNHLIANDWNIWYTVRPSFRVGFGISHFSTPNMPTNQQQEIGCSGNSGQRVGKDCSWTSYNLYLVSDW